MGMAKVGSELAIENDDFGTFCECFVFLFTRVE